MSAGVVGMGKYADALKAAEAKSLNDGGKQ
jgi:hypothetical protein